MTTDDVRISIVIVGSTGVIDGVIVVITVETTGGGEEGGGEEGGGEEGGGEGEGERETDGSMVGIMTVGIIVSVDMSGSIVVSVITIIITMEGEGVASGELVMTLEFVSLTDRLTDWAWQYVVAMATSNSKSFASDVVMVIFPRVCVCVCVCVCVSSGKIVNQLEVSKSERMKEHTSRNTYTFTYQNSSLKL